MSRNGWACLAALLLFAAGCSPAAEEGGAGPTASIAKSAAGDADLISIESDTVVDGRRPRLILVCEQGKPPTFQLDLVRAPASPAPTRGVFAQMQVKGGPLVTVELGWIGAATWQARYPHPSQPETDTKDRNNRARILPILHAFTRERDLTLTPPPAYAPAGYLVWSPKTLGPHLAVAQDCAALDRPTIDGPS